MLANPCAARTRWAYGTVLSHAAVDHDRAVTELRLALSINPFRQLTMRANLGQALLLAGRPEEALVELRWSAARAADYGPCHRALVIAAAETGRMEEARAALREVVRLTPDRTLRNIAEMWFYRDPAVIERFRAAFRAAGLPE
ncbi:MAG: tetratricopeptide repeat protein [Acetobacteraceae bacterium]